MASKHYLTLKYLFYHSFWKNKTIVSSLPTFAKKRCPLWKNSPPPVLHHLPLPIPPPNPHYSFRFRHQAFTQSFLFLFHRIMHTCPGCTALFSPFFFSFGQIISKMLVNFSHFLTKKIWDFDRLIFVEINNGF